MIAERLMDAAWLCTSAATMSRQSIDFLKAKVRPGTVPLWLADFEEYQGYNGIRVNQHKHPIVISLTMILNSGAYTTNPEGLQLMPVEMHVAEW